MHTSTHSSWADEQKQETAKTILAKLHAQHYLEKPRDERPAQVQATAGRRGLQKIFKCLVSVSTMLSISFRSQSPKRSNKSSFQSQHIKKMGPGILPRIDFGALFLVNG